MSTVDVLATVLDVLEHPSPPAAADPQRSLLRLDEHANRLVFSQTRRKGARDSVVDGRWKMIRNNKTGDVELFDLIEDPGELRNRAVLDTTLVAKLGAQLDEWLTTLQHQRDATPEPAVPVISEGERARLRALGYEE